MKLAIIGATGFVGSAVVNEALAQGHQVTAFVRNTAKVPTHANLSVIGLDIFNESALTEELKGHDAVISAYNPGWTNENIRQDMIDGSAHIVAATKNAGISSLLVVGGAGSLEIAPGLQLVDTETFPAEWKEGALGARQVLNDLKAEQTLDWVFLSPAVFLEPGERTGQFRYGKDTVLMNGQEPGRISVEDLAVAIIEEVTNRRFHFERFTIAY